MDGHEFENETRKHQQEVSRCLEAVACALLDRSKGHDASKLEDPERAMFIEYTGKLRALTYGSQAYKDTLKEMGPALQHHYADNRHHPEHFPTGVDSMDLVDVVEMFCDWFAACQRHDDGNIFKSIGFNGERFKISSQLSQVFRNTVSHGLLE